MTEIGDGNGAADDGAHPLVEARRPFPSWALAAFAFAIALIAAGTWSLPLMDPDEGRNAQVAFEMASSGDWVIPTYGGIPYLDKPAFFFALVALSFRALGSGEVTARLPSGIFALALLLLVYAFCAREYGRRAW